MFSMMKYLFVLFTIFPYVSLDEEMLNGDEPPNEESVVKDSAFDEIYYNNKQVGLELNLPFNRRIYQADIMQKCFDESLTNKRHVVRDELKLWRTREIPYTIAPELGNATQLIKDAIDIISTKSCLKFKERTIEENFVQFVKKTGCWSYVGIQTGGQEISIGEGCEKIEIVLHEIMHMLGFLHENSRGDRDTYIEIIWQNIKPAYQRNFDILDNGNVSTGLYEPYDLNSLMHYGSRAFGDGRETIKARKKDESFTLGNKDGLSNGDVTKLNKLYHCKTIPSGGYGPWKIERTCSNTIKRKYRVCYGDKLCEQPNTDGVQHVQMRCDEDYKGVMEGCFRHGNSYTEHIPYQDKATQDSCLYFNNCVETSLAFKVAYAYLECRRHAKINNSVIFGLSNYCKCHYGNDAVNIDKNGVALSAECGDGYAITENAIYLYKVLNEP